MRIARIVSSNSHIEYIARVVDTLDVAKPPSADDYGFGRFVLIETGEGVGIVGVVCNSMLMNPDYAQFGPRLSPRQELESFSPDFLNEQGCLLSIILLGQLESGKKVSQGIPSSVIPAGQHVRTLSTKEIGEFHEEEPGTISIHYFSNVMSHAGTFAAPLIEDIISQLSKFEQFSESELKKLSVLRRSLVWQRTVGQMRL